MHGVIDETYYSDMIMISQYYLFQRHLIMTVTILQHICLRQSFITILVIRRRLEPALFVQPKYLYPCQTLPAAGAAGLCLCLWATRPS